MKIRLIPTRGSFLLNLTDIRIYMIYLLNAVWFQVVTNLGDFYKIFANKRARIAKYRPAIGR